MNRMDMEMEYGSKRKRLGLDLRLNFWNRHNSVVCPYSLFTSLHLAFMRANVLRSNQKKNMKWFGRRTSAQCTVGLGRGSNN
jgi:hypothetical protein